MSANSLAADCNMYIFQFAVMFANAFERGKLESLDSVCSANNAIQVTVEHSLGGGEDELNGETGETSIHSFKELDGWLESRRIEGRPWPAMWPLQDCSGGVCKFGGNFANQAHGYLFLKKMQYKMTHNHLIITHIIFEDGD